MTTARRILIAASVLTADFSRLGEECAALEEAGVDRIQWDVMDGRFVPNLTFGPDVIASVRDKVSLGFEAHLMVEQPDELAHRYAEAGCELLIVHAEACKHLHRTLDAIRSLGVAAGVAINPATPAEAVENVLDLCDLVLVMTVNPGFGGQKYLAGMEPKIAQVKDMAAAYDIDIEVDGGIGPETAAGAVKAGANVLVAGSSLYRTGGGWQDVGKLYDAVEAVRSAARAMSNTVPESPCE